MTERRVTRAYRCPACKKDLGIRNLHPTEKGPRCPEHPDHPAEWTDDPTVIQFGWGTHVEGYDPTSMGHD